MKHLLSTTAGVSRWSVSDNYVVKVMIMYRPLGHEGMDDDGRRIVHNLPLIYPPMSLLLLYLSFLQFVYLKDNTTVVILWIDKGEFSESFKLLLLGLSLGPYIFITFLLTLLHPT